MESQSNSISHTGELTQQHIREVFTELFYNRRRERERQIRVWPNRIAEYPMTPQEAFHVPQQAERINIGLNSAAREYVRQYIEGENNHILRLHDRSLLEEMTTYGRQYDMVMATIMAQSEIAFKASLQKETNKASPYLDFDNY